MNPFNWICCCFILLVTLCDVHGLPPMALRLRTKLTELSMKTLDLVAGSKVSITCDGSSIDLEDDPKLSWYSPDKYLIENEDFHKRIFTKVSKSKKYRKLTIKDVRESDAGKYVCLGWHRLKARWDIIKITLVVGQHAAADDMQAMTSDTAPSSQSSTRRTTQMTKYTVVKSSTGADNSSSPSGYEILPKEDCFMCQDGQCIPPDYECDGAPDCVDASDELNCISTLCVEDEVLCQDGTKCVLDDEFCDGNEDCPDGSDEDPTTCSSP